MKRFLVVGLAALGLAVAARPVQANCFFEYSNTRHFSFVHTQKNRCFSYSSHVTPLPCMSSSGGGYSGPAAPAYGYAPPAYGYPAAPVVAAPAVAAPAATAPAFNAPQPKQTPSSTAAVQQAGYFYYGPTANTGYNYNNGAGYHYYGYGAGYSQAPNYWYDN